MAWKAGSGRIGIGVIKASSQKTDADGEAVLPQGQSVVVVDTNFKLVAKT
jgi:hypothetical protein